MQRALDESAFCDVLLTSQMLAAFPRFWCFCGGWAIDLFVNRLTREHKDVDIAIRRADQLHMRAYLEARGWTLQLAFKGALKPWPEDEYLNPPFHEIWCQNPEAEHPPIEIRFVWADSPRGRRIGFAGLHVVAQVTVFGRQNWDAACFS